MWARHAVGMMLLASGFWLSAVHSTAVGSEATQLLQESKLVVINGSLLAGDLNVTLELPNNHTLSLGINPSVIVAHNHTDGTVATYNTTDETDPGDKRLGEQQVSANNRRVTINGSLAGGDLNVTLELPNNDTLSLGINSSVIVSNNHTDGTVATYNITSETDPGGSTYSPFERLGEQQTNATNRSALPAAQLQEMVRKRNVLEAKAAAASVDLNSALTDAAKAKVSSDALQKEAEEALASHKSADLNAAAAEQELDDTQKDLRAVQTNLDEEQAHRAAEQAQQDQALRNEAMKNAAEESRSLTARAEEKAYEEDARSKKEIAAVEETAKVQAKQMIESANVKADAIRNDTSTKIAAAEEKSAADEMVLRQEAERAAQRFKSEAEHRVAQAKRDAAEAERQERVQAAARMEAIKQEANQEEAANILVKAADKAEAAGRSDSGSTPVDLSALDDMEGLHIESLAKTAVPKPEPPRVSEEDAKKQVRADFAVDDIQRAADTRQARDMIAKERADALERAQHAAHVHQIADETIEQKDHEQVALDSQKQLDQLENQGFITP